jgi:hypothetical protein
MELTGEKHEGVPFHLQRVNIISRCSLTATPLPSRNKEEFFLIGSAQNHLGSTMGLQM